MVNGDIFRTPSGILKSINLGIIIITVAIFYSKYNGWAQFIGTTIVSALVYIFVLLLTYVLGGMAIQKTFYEIFMNTYFALMFMISTIVAWVHGMDGGIPVTTGIFCLFSFFFFAVDIYFSLVAAGVFNTTAGGPQQGVPPNAVPPTININSAASFPSSVINPSATVNGPATISPSY